MSPNILAANDWDRRSNELTSQKIYLAHITINHKTQGPTTYYLSTTELDPNLTSHYYEPSLLAPLPTLRRNLESSLRGQAQITGGILNISALGSLHDIAIDYENWTLSGAGIELYVGFDGMDSTSFRQIFTGKLKEPKISSSIITVQIIDPTELLFRSRVPIQTWNDVSLPSFITSLLTYPDLTGYTIDLTDIVNNYADTKIFFSANERLAVSTVMEEVCTRLGMYWGFTRDGKFLVTTVYEPNLTDPVVLTVYDDQGEILSEQIDIIRRYWSMNFSYIDSVQYENNAWVVNRTGYSRSEQAIKDFNTFALESGEIVQWVFGTNNANKTHSDLMWDLNASKQRAIYRLEMKLQPFSVDLLDSVHYYRNGQLIPTRVVSVQEDLTRNITTLGLLSGPVSAPPVVLNDQGCLEEQKTHTVVTDLGNCVIDINGFIKDS